MTISSRSCAPGRSGSTTCGRCGKRSAATTGRSRRSWPRSASAARPEDSWAVRRALYEGLFAQPGTFVLIAELDSSPVGYALVHLRGPEETWASGDRVAELETLTVLPESRGRGVGTALVEAVFSELRALGVRQWAVGAIASNADAIRFYERFDVLPFMVAFIGNVPRPSWLGVAIQALAPRSVSAAGCGTVRGGVRGA